MQELTQIARQHPESVAFVFSQYGYSKIPVDGKSIKAMAVKFGHPFLTALASQIANESDVSNFNFAKIGTGIKNLVTKKDKRNISGVVSSGSGIKNTGIIAPRATLANGLVITAPTAIVPTSTNNMKAPKNGGFVDKVLGLLERGAGIYSGVKQTQMDANNQVYQQEAQVRQKSNLALIAAAVVTIILIVALISFKGKTTVK